MVKPFKEVILFNNLQRDLGTIKVDVHTKYKLKESTIHVLWGGSIQKFIEDFELPEDSIISEKELGINDTGANVILNWNYTTINFKFNYQVWYKDATSGNFYVLGSNNTVDVTCPNVICYNGDADSDSANYYAGSPGGRIYNPNIFPLPITISSFVTSNKSNDFQAVIGSGTDSLAYLVFRFGIADGNAVGGTTRDDIQICLLTKNSNSFQVNGETLIIPYASLTFTGFNKIKRLPRING